MARTTVPFTLDHLDALDELGVPCRSCLFWELDPVRRGRLADAETRAGVKESWMSEVLREWGSCGRVALVDGQAVGYLTYAPPSYVPGAAQFPTAPASPDSVLLITAHVSDGYDDGGIGRLLVQGMARDLVGRGGIKAVEAFAHRRRRLSPESGCLLPAEFLARVGFKTHRQHPFTPRMRMELRSLVTWRDEVEAAFERLVGVVHPTKRPTPAHRDLN
ncbi:GNAT family N-acetyltransferase [Nocardioides immobilis]|uniref:GNAT family N-acetyltransferase n=1 Tax=Nocardioides immobilis TaxID=2049295 RepID=A0A417Y166_9ACTN|nr:GNAT family N-acetyltransferase [Nocardioides immobilis]RHW26392.1 GNAT family N-acetyltransferase [Nocardioides immobilis]